MCGWIGALPALALLTYPLPTAWLGLAVIATLPGVRRKRAGRPFPASALGVPLLLYLAGAVIGLAVSDRPLLAQIRFFGLLAGLAVFSLVRDLVRTPEAAARLTRLWTLALLATACGLLVVVDPQPISHALAGPWRGSNDDLPAALAWSRQLLDEHDDLSQRFRLTSAGVGTLAAIAMGMAWGSVVAGPTTRRSRSGWLVAGAALLLLLLAGNRGALLSAMLTVALLGALRWRWLLAVAALVPVAVSVLAVRAVPPALADAVNRALGLRLDKGIAPDDLYLRFEFWREALFVSSDFRFSGVGLSFRAVRETVRSYFLWTEPPFTHSHNAAIQSLLEQGVLGLAGLVSLGIAGVLVGWQAVRTARDREVRATAIAGGGAALTLALVGLTESLPLTTVGMTLLFGALGLIEAIGRFEKRAVDRVGLVQPSDAGALRWAVGWPLALLTLGAALLVLPLTSGGFAPRRAENTSVGWPLTALAADAALNLGAIEVNAMQEAQRPSDEQLHRERAVKLLSWGLEADPSHTGLLRKLAEAQIEADPGRARRLLLRAEASAQPGDRQLYFQLGRLYRAIGDVRRAIEAWTRADAGQQLVVWGAELVERRQWRTALEVNRAAIELMPNEPGPYRGVRVALSARVDFDEVVARLQEYVDRYPSVPWPCVELGDLYAAVGRLDEAREWYLRAIELAPQTPIIRQRLDEL
jgi:hypothetical protein